MFLDGFRTFSDGFRKLSDAFRTFPDAFRTAFVRPDSQPAAGRQIRRERAVSFAKKSPKLTFLPFWVSEMVKSVEIGGTPLARSAPKFCEFPRQKCPKQLDGDPFGDKKM